MSAAVCRSSLNRRSSSLLWVLARWSPYHYNNNFAPLLPLVRSSTSTTSVRSNSPSRPIDGHLEIRRPDDSTEVKKRAGNTGDRNPGLHRDVLRAQASRPMHVDVWNPAAYLGDGDLKSRSRWPNAPEIGRRAMAQRGFRSASHDRGEVPPQRRERCTPHRINPAAVQRCNAPDTTRRRIAERSRPSLNTACA